MPSLTALSRAFLVAQMVKNLPAMWEFQIQFLRQEDPLETGKATHSWVVHRQRSLAGYTVHGVAESDMTE